MIIYSNILLLCAFFVFAIFFGLSPNMIRFEDVEEVKMIMGFSKSKSTIPHMLLTSVLIVNSPQLLYSMVYFQWNSIFTSMLMSREWSAFGIERKSLRVSSNPGGHQRSDYFLNLPYRYSLPLMAISALSHWLLSQGVFIIAMERIERATGVIGWEIMSCGVSVGFILVILCLTLALHAWIFISGTCRRFPSAMPVAGSCSLTIAAACHHPEGGPHPETSLGYVKWGVMKNPDVGGGIGHCGFSCELVDEPQRWGMYA